MAQALRIAERDFAFEARVKAELREKHRPENIAALDRNKALRGQPFVIVFEFHLLPEKRPDREMAPCPICSPNHPKYYHGALAWFPVEGVYRCIGWRCCVHHIGKVQSEEAKRNYHADKRRKADYEFLFANLWTAPRMVHCLESLKPAAQEAERLRRLIGAEVREYLREAVKENGSLTFWETRQVERFDPFRGEDVTVTERTPNFLRLSGDSAIAKKLPLLHELHGMLAKLAFVDRGDRAAAEHWVLENAWNHPTDMTAFCSILRKARAPWTNVRTKADDVLAFFTEYNFASIAAFGAARRNNPIYASVKHGGFYIGLTMSNRQAIRPKYEVLQNLPRWPELTTS